MEIKKILQASTVRKLKDAVVIAFCLDYLDLLDDVLAIDHREEDYLSAQ